MTKTWFHGFVRAVSGAWGEALHRGSGADEMGSSIEVFHNNKFVWWRCVKGKHPFPSRTRRLRPLRPMVLCGRLHGRAGGCQTFLYFSNKIYQRLKRFFISIFGGVAQLGEHLPCKQGVMSSNLTISTRLFRTGRATAEESAAGTLKTEYRQANIDCFDHYD